MDFLGGFNELLPVWSLSFIFSCLFESILIFHFSSVNGIKIIPLTFLVTSIVLTLGLLYFHIKRKPSYGN
jgi:hypothetical protein